MCNPRLLAEVITLTSTWPNRCGIPIPVRPDGGGLTPVRSRPCPYQLLSTYDLATKHARTSGAESLW